MLWDKFSFKDLPCFHPRNSPDFSPSLLATLTCHSPASSRARCATGIRLPDGQRLLVTTDRLSAFDRILACVPYKGQVLNQLAAWWFDQTADIIPNHAIRMPDPNALVAQEVAPFPVEVIVRGYITGVTSTALWYRYSLGEREIYGYHFPEGLKKNQALPDTDHHPHHQRRASPGTMSA